MYESLRVPWVRAVLLVGVTYLAVGIIFGTLAGWAASHQIRAAWRLAAWLISAVVFGVHVGYGQLQLRSSPRTTALHASLAVALGAFALATAAMVRTQVVTGHARYLAFLVWPVLSGLPAFVVALAVAAVLARAGRKT